MTDADNSSHEPTLFDLLEELMEKEKPFLNPDLSREEVSRALLTNDLYLRNAIKEATDQTFGAYIGKLRLEHIQNLLLDPKEETTPIAVLGYSSGFNSARTLNRLFKETYGLTPGEFRNGAMR